MAKSARAAIQFRCPHCITLLGARRRSAGKEMRCPCCHTDIRVPTVEEAEARAEKARKTGAYGFVKAGTGAAAKTYFTVNCPVCHTRLDAAPDEVGSEIVCPDCDTKVVVPPPPVALVPPGPDEKELAKRLEEYNLLVDEGGTPTAGVLEVYEPHFGFKCPVCGTRLLATEDQVGQTIICPDCEHRCEVRPPPPPRPAPHLEIDPTIQYDATDPGEGPDYSAMIEQIMEKAEQRLREEESEKPPHEPIVQRAPPRWLFRSGVITFLGYPGVRGRLFSLTAALTGVGLVLWFGSVVASSGHPAFYFLGVMIAVLSLLLAVVCIPLTLSVVLTIAQDTGDGNDQIENWPEGAWIDWILESLYIVCSLAVSGLPGIVLASFFQITGAPRIFIAHTSAMILFPYALMSALENGSPFLPVSWPVLRGMLGTWRAWLKFYVITVVLLTGFFFFAYFASRYAGSAGGLLAIAMVVPSAFLYFRLLGRLAMFCSDPSIEADSELPGPSDEVGDSPYDRFIRDEP